MNKSHGDGSASLPLHHLLIAAAKVPEKIMAEGLVQLSVCLRGDGVQRDQRSAIVDGRRRACVASLTLVAELTRNPSDMTSAHLVRDNKAS